MKKTLLSGVIVSITKTIKLNFINLILFTLLTLVSIPSFSQTHINQNGIQTTVIGSFSANEIQARRFEVATVGYNSYHWQAGGVITVELFNITYGTAYEKYSVEIGYGQGGQGYPEVKLTDSQGMYHHAKIALGTPYDLTTEQGGYINKAIPIYLDIKYYSHYKVRLTYMHTKVTTLTSSNQIKINENPSPINISDFTVSTIINEDVNRSGNLMIRGSGNHFIEKGNVGIGTTTPKEMLDVTGTIRAKEVKIEINAGADHVFNHDYDLKPLSEVEHFIKTNKHLPEVPSEKQMQAEGLNINEFQIKLLQKIEELTLYAIQQEKKNRELEKEIKDLKSNLLEK